MSSTTRRILIGAALTAVFAGVGTGIGIASATGSGSGDDSADVAISGDALTRAGEAALAQTGGGTVVDSEVEENGYEVEVNMDDGSQREVQLDKSFAVVDVSVNEEGDDGDAD